MLNMQVDTTYVEVLMITLTFEWVSQFIKSQSRAT